MLRLYRIHFAFLVSLITLSALIAPAYSQEATAALAQANRFLQQGAPAKAIELINRTLQSGQLASNAAARALLMRAQAQEKLGKFAYALADYNQALWQGLTGQYKSSAEAGRNRIMAKLGVGDGKVAKKRDSPSNGATWGASEVKTAASQEQTSKTNIFGNLFTSTQSPPTSQPPKPSEPKRVAQANVQQFNSVVAARSNPDPAQEPTGNVVAVAGEASGDFAIQMAALHSEKGAIYEVNRIQKRYGEWLGGRSASITVRGMNDGGTLYKVIAGPYERGEGIATCELLKSKGLSCMLISR